MDADDLLSSNKIELQVKALNIFKNKVAVCNYIEFSTGERIEELKVSEYQKKFIFSTNNTSEFLINLWGANGGDSFVQTNCWLMPKHLVVQVGGWRNYSSVDDDGEFFTRLLLKSEGIVFVQEPLVYYRRSILKNRLSNSKNYHLVKNKLLTIDLKYKFIKPFVDTEKLKKAFSIQYLDFAVYNYPQHKNLSRIAFKRYKALNTKARLPLLGGKIIEHIKNIFGWKFARLIKYYFR